MVGIGIDNVLANIKSLLESHPKGYRQRIRQDHKEVNSHRELLIAEGQFFPRVRDAILEYDFLYAKYEAGLV